MARRNSIGGQFAPRLIEMIGSPAHRTLSLSARRVLDRIEIELAQHGGKDNGRLPVTFADFEASGINRHAIAPAIREAVALGFLEIAAHGCAGNAEHRAPNLYRLTYRNLDRMAATHPWRNVKTVEQAEQLAKAARISPGGAEHRVSKTSVGKRQVSVLETDTENACSPVSETNTTGSVRKKGVLSISPVGTAAQTSEQVAADESSSLSSKSPVLWSRADMEAAFASRRATAGART